MRSALSALAGIAIAAAALLAGEGRHPASAKELTLVAVRLAYALGHPAEAIASPVKVSPEADPAVETETLKATAVLIESAATKQNGIGWSDKARWEAAQALMLENGGLTRKVDDVTTFYTNDFVPKS